MKPILLLTGNTHFEIELWYLVTKIKPVMTIILTVMSMTVTAVVAVFWNFLILV